MLLNSDYTSQESYQDIIKIRRYGLVDYSTLWEEMKAFTNGRDSNTVDELWLCEHPAIYTLGQAGKLEHLLEPSSIPLIHTDRGGQITYHGPGQFIAYPLINILRKNIGVSQMVRQLEESIILLLNSYGIKTHLKCNAPGVYVNEEKICSIGLRIRKHCSFHGLALNVNMDLSPFKKINPCGFPDQKMTQLSHFGIEANMLEISQKWVSCFCNQFCYTPKFV